MVKPTPGIYHGIEDMPKHGPKIIAVVVVSSVIAIGAASAISLDRSLDKAEPNIKQLKETVERMDRQVQDMDKELGEIQRLSDQIAEEIVRRQSQGK